MTNQQFFRWNIVINACMALCINTMGVILAGGTTLAGWITGCCCAFAFNTVTIIFIPADKLIHWFTKKVCRARDGTAWEFFTRNVIMGVVNITLVSLLMAMLHTGINSQTIPHWLATYGQLLLTGLIAIMLIEKPIQKLIRIWK